MVLGKAGTGAVAGAAIALLRPDLAVAAVAGGSLITNAKFDPISDPAKLGTQYGQAVGEGLTWNVGDAIAGKAINPALKKLNSVLYAQTQTRLGGTIDAGQDYIRLLLGRYASGTPTMQ
jgi:hypothetical protein